VQRGYLSELFVSFQGEGLHVGRRHLFVRLSGCNLRCRYCDTPGSLERETSFRVRDGAAAKTASNPVSVDEVIDHCARLVSSWGSIDGVAITGGEPLLQSEFLAALLGDDRLPRPRVLETNGMLPDRLAAVLPHIDSVSMDIKIPSNTGEPGFWDEHERFLGLARGKAYVKILVDRDTDQEEVARAGRLISSTAPNTPTYLQPITEGDSKVALDQWILSAMFAELRRYIADVRVLPQTHKMLGIP
jgi:organic radical activating enzyme